MKKGAPKHQNKIGFKMRYHEHYNDKITNAPLDRLCPICLSQIEWKIKYGKYKTPHDLSKCIKCERKIIFKAYRRLCDNCSDELKQCSKCMENIENGEQSSSGEEMEETLKCLRERSKRTILRKLEKDEISWDKHKQKFIDNETGEQIIIQFKKDYIDDEDEELWEDNDINDNDNDDDSSQSDENDKKPKTIQQKQTQQKQQQKKTKKQQSESSESSESSDDESEEENEEQFKQQNKEPSIYSDGSNENDYIYRQEKNFRYYFGDQEKEQQFV